MNIKCIVCIKLWRKREEIGDKKGNVTADGNEVQVVVREYFGKLENLKEMEKKLRHKWLDKLKSRRCK